MDWISVEDKLPEFGDRVIVYYSGNDARPPRIDVTNYVPHLRFLLDGVYGPVTHWMPLPDPPAAKVKQKEEQL